MKENETYALVAQLDRVFGYEPKGRGFESLRARHVVASYVSLATTFYASHEKSSRAHSAAPPFPQKVTLGAPARLQAPSRRLAVAINLLRISGVQFPPAKRQKYLFHVALTKEAYEVEDQGARRVRYVSRDKLIRAITDKFPQQKKPRPRTEQPSGGPAMTEPAETSTVQEINHAAQQAKMHKPMRTG